MKLINLLFISIIIFIIALFLYNINIKEGLTSSEIEEGKRCSNFNEIKNNTFIKNINYELYSKYKLKDFYIKTAYNSCCVGYFKNDYVDLCSLYLVLKQGVRCLDFEIRSIDNKPHVTSSLNDNNYFKESYNSLYLEDVFKTINMYAFSLPTTNFNDPLILHFRIKSNNIPMYDDFTKLLEKHFSKKLLPPKYKHDYNGKNLGNELLMELLGRVIIVIDKSNSFYQNTSLYKYCNMSSNSSYLKLLKNSQLDDINKNQMVEYNKNNMSILIPDLTNSIYNLNGVNSFKYGIQMVAMNYQNYDNNLEKVIKYFDSNEKAFVLKPVNQLNTKDVLQLKEDEETEEFEDDEDEQDE